MIVTLSDPIITVEGWTHDLDKLGEFTLKVRKTPIELREEKQERMNRYGSCDKIDLVRRIPKTCITKDPNHPDVAYFLPGLWPRVKTELDRRGAKYEIVDKRNPDIRPPLDVSAFEGVEFRENQDVAIALIASSDCGIIETATAFGKSFCISLLCKAYPTLNIVVTTSSTQVVNTLYEYMCKTIPGQVGILMGGKDRTAGKRVIVTTLKSLPNIPPEKVQLLFVDEAHNVGDNQAGRDIMKFAFARRFGFSASPVRNDGSGLMLEAILGPTILKMSYQEAADAGMVTPMKYYMIPCGSCPPLALREGLPEYMLKRWSYWSNRSRNEAIKRTVYAIKNVYDGQILVMVSTLAHAIELHRLLPWFRVAYYGSVDMSELRERFPPSKYPGLDLAQYKMNTKQLDIMRGAFAKGTLRYVISTKVFRQGVSFNELACLIRADGDTSEIECIQVPGRLSRLDKGKFYAYLIDVMDTFSDWALRRAKSRQSQYDKQQWEQITYEELLNGLSEQSTGNGSEPPGEQCQQ
jgi:superfamily II DNA or RNA helicase